MDRPLGLDLYCCAGGARAGYEQAGFLMVGVDKDPQPRYQGPFFQADALAFLQALIAGARIWLPPLAAYVALEDFAFIHASPPCQLFCMYNNVKSIAKSTSEKYENLIPGTRELLAAAGKPYIIENVTRARGHLVNPVQLCGTTFGIPVRRHRLFELGNWTLTRVPPCAHHKFTERRFPGSTNRPNGRTVCNIGEYRVPLTVQKECMEVDWPVTLHELSEMVPPAMTRFLGLDLLEYLSIDLGLVA